MPTPISPWLRLRHPKPGLCQRYRMVLLESGARPRTLIRALPDHDDESVARLRALRTEAPDAPLFRSWLAGQSLVMGDEKSLAHLELDAGKRRPERSDGWRALDDHSLHAAAVTSEGQVVAGVNVHRQGGRFRIGWFWVLQAYRGQRMLVTLGPLMCVHLLCAEPRTKKFIHARCPHAWVDLAEPGHSASCPYHGNDSDNTVFLYSRFGWRIPAHAQPTCDGGTGAIELELGARPGVTGLFPRWSARHVYRRLPGLRARSTTDDRTCIRVHG